MLATAGSGQLRALADSLGPEARQLIHKGLLSRETAGASRAGPRFHYEQALRRAMKIAAAHDASN